MTKINNIMHLETPYKTIQRTKYIVQVLVCKLAAMSEKNSVCIFCNEGNGVARIFFWGGPIFPDLLRPTRFGGGGG